MLWDNLYVELIAMSVEPGYIMDRNWVKIIFSQNQTEQCGFEGCGYIKT